MRVNPIISIRGGHCRAAFEYYEKVLHGKNLAIMTNGESPIADQMPAESRGLVMHARMDIGGTWLMGADAHAGESGSINGAHVSLMIDEPAEADRVFAALADGGTVTMPIQSTFWATRFGMLVDRFGVPWMIDCELPVIPNFGPKGHHAATA
jgi:PhnB protein